MQKTIREWKKNRNHFDQTMWDNLQIRGMEKVFTHQLNKCCKPNLINSTPAPNLFVMSANQHADNAADMA